MLTLKNGLCRTPFECQGDPVREGAADCGPVPCPRTREEKESRKIINSMGKHRWTGVAHKGRCELPHEGGGGSTVILAPESRLGGSVS